MRKLGKGKYILAFVLAVSLAFACPFFDFKSEAATPTEGTQVSVAVPSFTFSDNGVVSYDLYFPVDNVISRITNGDTYYYYFKADVGPSTFPEGFSYWLTDSCIMFMGHEYSVSYISNKRFIAQFEVDTYEYAPIMFKTTVNIQYNGSFEFTGNNSSSASGTAYTTGTMSMSNKDATQYTKIQGSTTTSSSGSTTYNLYLVEPTKKIDFSRISTTFTSNETGNFSFSSSQVTFPRTTFYLTFVDFRYSYVAPSAIQVRDSVSAQLQTQGNQLQQEANNLQTQANQLQQTQNQLQEQTNQSLTTFEGKSEMDATSDKLNSSLTEYDVLESSIFATADNNVSAFDYMGAFTFSAELALAVSFVSEVYALFINAMGNFTLIYTLGIALVIVGVLTGIWRFFADD